MKVLPIGPGVKKAVILAGEQITKLAPLTNHCPAWMFPVLNKPLINHTIDFLRKNGFEDIIIALSEETKIPDSLKENNVPGINIKFHKEDRPRGTAGVLKDLENVLDNEPFFVIESSLFLEHVDLNKFLKFYKETDFIAAVGVYRDSNNRVEENVIITDNNLIKSFHIIHPSADRRSPWRPSGLFLFNPRVLTFIDRQNYMDIKEQLIPAVQREGLNVFACEIEGPHFLLRSMNDYINLHRALLLRNGYHKFDDKEEIAKGVWVGKNVKISPKAYLSGPICVGDGCEIRDWAQIIGPTVIGEGCRIAEEAVIRESILWSGVSLSKKSRIEYSIIGERANVSNNFLSKNMILLNGLSIRDVTLIPSDQSIKGIINLSDVVSTIVSRKRMYEIAKRITDIILSATGIILLIPFLLLVAIAIRIDSPGSVFYIQKRCGRGGKLFDMIKLRTMVATADQLQKQLIENKETDGPMFKMSNDPRVTRVGRILRKTSLDEIPQLFNVLKGDMSLVGPRPLIMDEMTCSPSWRDIRLMVKPGITGLWQVQGRSEAPFHDWIRYDVYYVKNQSLRMDIEILFKTIKVVLKKSGAH